MSQSDGRNSLAGGTRAGWNVLASGRGLSPGDSDAAEGPVGARSLAAEEVDVSSR